IGFVLADSGAVLTLTTEEILDDLPAGRTKDSSVMSTVLVPSLLRRMCRPPSPMIAFRTQGIFIGSL
ncbi:hypothetical protein ACWC1D_34565, partial [Streptomyces sp. NPDC001478]